LAAGVAGAAQPAADRFTLAIMRRDGVLIPFASYDGDWSTPWPATTRDLELPIRLDDVPEKWWGGPRPAKWALWPIGREGSVPVAPKAPLSVIIGRETRVGVLTDYVSAESPAPPYEMPYPKEGLVVGGTLQPDTILRVSRRAASWQNLTTVLEQEIDDAEERAVRMLRSGARWQHPVPESARRATTAELEAWYTSSLEQPGFAISYIEAVKKYPPGEEDQGCGLETFVSGWIHSNQREKKPKTQLTARITYCDRAGVSYMLPLALLRLKSRTHWVFQVSSWESEWYTVTEATPGRVRFVVEYFAGGRPIPIANRQD
jgi:hypothetical protein